MGVSLQELIVRGRFLFSRAPGRFEVFKLTDGKRTAKDIANKVGRTQSSVLHDLRMLRDFELIVVKRDPDGGAVKKNESTIHEKSALARNIPVSYFQGVAKTDSLAKPRKRIPVKGAPSVTSLHIPNEKEILDICRGGETQLYEFKGPGAGAGKIAKEIAAFLHTRRGGIIFYGVDDDGTIIGSDQGSQSFDQRIQNSVRNTINPAPTVRVLNKKVLGSEVALVVTPAWDRKTLYQFRDGRYYIRKGTNVFSVTPQEMKKLNQGKYVI